MTETMRSDALQVDLGRHPCALCGRPIIHAFLMCGPHWRLVPPAEQLAVYRSWNALSLFQPTGKKAPPRLFTDYLAAKDAAIASARAALDQPLPIQTTAQEAT